MKMGGVGRVDDVTIFAAANRIICSLAAVIYNVAMSTSIATFGGGCFWCLEACFEQLQGISSVVSGYTGGIDHLADYKSVCGGKTGHAEVVQVTFDPAVITYKDLLLVFFAMHDPTTVNRQGNDVGPQYRSAIFTHDDAQTLTAMATVSELEEEEVFPLPIVTTIQQLVKFFPAESYHQGYFRANPAQPYCMGVVSPKVAKLRQKFAGRLKTH
ncbi:peptide-methionine (S)-S-oxide reductase MsrA [soil metagenome]